MHFLLLLCAFRLSGDLVAASEELRRHLTSTYSPSFSPYLKPSLHAKVARYGNYPLATRDRMDELRMEQAREASLLYEKYGDKWPLDPLTAGYVPLGKEKCRKLWRRAFIYAKAIAAMMVKPPKQQTRQELDKLLQVALQATRRKIYYEWDMILGAFQIDAAEEKKRQRRLKMKVKNSKLLAPKGIDIRASSLAYALRSRVGPKCTRIEVCKLFAHQLGPHMNGDAIEGEAGWIMDEEKAEVILDYCESAEKVPLSNSLDPQITYQLFYDAIYPSEEERAEWDDMLAEKIRQEREKKIQDERVRKIYEQKMEAARSKAMAAVNEAWERSYREIYADSVAEVVALRMQDPAYAKAKYKVGWSVPICEAHRKSLYHIFTAGKDDAEFQTTTRRRMNAEHFARNGGLTIHVPLGPVRQCMVNCIQYSRGLDGLKAKEACELILEYLATRLQATFRGLKKRRVSQRAMRMWKRKIAEVKSIFYSSWATWALNRVAIRRYCWRPLREWNKYFKSVNRVSYLRGCRRCPCKLWGGANTASSRRLFSFSPRLPLFLRLLNENCITARPSNNCDISLSS